VSGRPWRLLVTEPVDGATNMAIDEALWRGRQTGGVPPTLRFFAWDPPTVSLGYGQALDDAVSVEMCRRLGVGIVRRPTGGSAIYHDGPERELTYSVVATNEDLGVTADVLEAYRWISRALATGLRALGVPADIVAAPRVKGPAPAFCFARTGRYEIEIGGRKLVGSAQRRTAGAYLQQGSILLGDGHLRIADYLAIGADARERVRDALRLAAGSAAPWLGTAPPLARFADALKAELGPRSTQVDGASGAFLLTVSGSGSYTAPVA